MPLSPILTAKVLVAAFHEEPMSPDVLIRAVLKGVLVNKNGAAMHWPALATLTVGRLFQLRVMRPDWNDGKPFTAQHCLGVLIARRAQQVLERKGQFPRGGFSKDAEQIKAMHQAARKVFDTLWDIPVHNMLSFGPDDDTGFFQWNLPTELTELEKEVVTEVSPAPDANGFTRLAFGSPVQGYSLSTWRARYANPCESEESVYGCVAVLTNHAQEVVAYVLARAVFLPPDIGPDDVLWALGGYDAVGLELGYSLRAQLINEDLKLDDLLDGGGLLHLYAMEVREAERSSGENKGLGVAMLKAALPLMAKGLPAPVTKLVTALQPFQFSYPVDLQLPAGFVLDVLDAADRLREHLDTTKPQDSVPEMRGSHILYLATDPRAKGTTEEQQALCQEVRSGSA